MLLAVARFSAQSGGPSFEVVSVKPTQSGSRGGPGPFVNTEPGRLVARGMLGFVIEYAYGMNGSYVEGEPSWLRSNRFDHARVALVSDIERRARVVPGIWDWNLICVRRTTSRTLRRTGVYGRRSEWSSTERRGIREGYTGVPYDRWSGAGGPTGFGWSGGAGVPAA